jgi:hypothetical protein
VVAVLKKAEQPSSLIPVGAALALVGGIAALQFYRRRTGETRRATEEEAPLR